MTNHVHILLTPQAADACTGLMRDLGQRYVQYFNRCYERTGTLWEGRFRSCIAESALYVLGCYRYIELNPVRAGMVDHPSSYLWSSYAVNSGARSDSLISGHAEYLALATDAHFRDAAYRGLFDQRLEPRLQKAIRDATNGGYPLASEGFKRNVLARNGFRTEPGQAGRPAKSPEAIYALDQEIGL
jgi:putative transposase